MPYRKNVSIPEDKLLNYILSETHTVGKLKAKFFRGAGFNEGNVNILKNSLLKIASNEVKNVITSAYGKKYVIEGKIKSPEGKILKLVTIWIIETGKTIPRFVTTYPL